MLGPASAELAKAGSTALVGAMATGAWPGTRSRVGRLFGRGRQSRQERVEAQLDADAARVAQAADPDEIRQSLVPFWRRELEGLLRRHPDAAPELQALVAGVQEALPAAQQGWVRQHTAADRAP